MGEGGAWVGCGGEQGGKRVGWTGARRSPLPSPSPSACRIRFLPSSRLRGVQRTVLRSFRRPGLCPRCPWLARSRSSVVLGGMNGTVREDGAYEEGDGRAGTESLDPKELQRASRELGPFSDSRAGTGRWLLTRGARTRGAQTRGVGGSGQRIPRLLPTPRPGSESPGTGPRDLCFNKLAGPSSSDRSWRSPGAGDGRGREGRVHTVLPYTSQEPSPRWPARPCPGLPVSSAPLCLAFNARLHPAVPDRTNGEITMLIYLTDRRNEGSGNFR